MLPFVDNLLTQTLSGLKPEFLTLFIPATLVLLLGGYDDLRGTNATVKFVGLGLIATLFYAMGGRIDALSIPLFGSVELPPRGVVCDHSRLAGGHHECIQLDRRT